MRLHVPCRTCGHSIPVRPAAKSRLALAGARGRTFAEPCPACGADALHHVDSVAATSDRADAKALLTGLLLAGIAAVLLWDRGWVATLPLLLGAGVYAAWSREAGARARAFNGYRLGGT